MLRQIRSREQGFGHLSTLHFLGWMRLNFFAVGVAFAAAVATNNRAVVAAPIATTIVTLLTTDFATVIAAVNALRLPLVILKTVARISLSLVQFRTFAVRARRCDSEYSI